jgi:DNA-binding response OmpR family regulator
MPLKVYYLDDEPDLCANFTDHFECEEIQVTTFLDAEKAISAVKDNPPDIFFIDYRLPGINGEEVAWITSDKIPKYLVTGESSVGTDYEFSGIIDKAHGIVEIRHILDEFLARLKLA